MPETEEDLISRVYRLVIESGSEGILQSELWKVLELTSRDGSRIASRLEKRRLIKRERVLQRGRWTYKLLPLVIPIDTSSIEDAPCIKCADEERCAQDSTVSPITCKLLEDWVLMEFRQVRSSAPA
ncbi:MAG: transcriptional regulator [Nitrososphaerota archaeon]|nr:transcriptional regulator [Nitrososphaerota archaeon]MDG6939474.1 transcriptional regulator [Nitrososphaerota archaeon]